MELSPTGGENADSESLIRQDGSLNEQLLAEQYGLGPEEAMQEVAFGAYSGTLAQALADDRCPVGGMVRAAYTEHGLEGVTEKLHTLGQLDPRFNVEVSPATLQREQLKKN
ncbi:MAG TPA: hypothetical protein VFH39_01895 [Candidatus Saccharimonadales bacterium]|nr:hypothetical protein [Candidatus Saccharimonadales bacterium]